VIRELKSLDPEIRDNSEQSALHVAAAMPHSAALRAMLEVFYGGGGGGRRGGTAHEHRHHDINHVNGAGDSALHVSCLEGDADKVRILLSSGANLEKRGSHNFTILHRLVKVCVSRRLISRYNSATVHFVWLVRSPGTVYHWTFFRHLHYQRSEICSRHICSLVPTSLTNCFQSTSSKHCTYGALVVTLAMLLRLVVLLSLLL